jgi:hypothetical protein
VDIVCYLCLQHTDHNVVSSSLETLEIILKYSNLFDFDQLLISTENNSIEETRVSERLRTNSSIYQRSFIDINEKPILNNKISDETDTNNEKRTSAAKLVQQLISKYTSTRKKIFRIRFFFLIRYILNSDGSIKSDDESRVSIKCATLICLSYLSTIDPFAFFDSFDYPTESM